MPLSFVIDAASVMPLRGIIFQCLLLLVAIVLEAIILRRGLRLGFQISVRYAATINLLTVVLGWILFLGIEPLLPVTVRTQIMSYILFGNFYINSLTESNGLGVVVIVLGLIIFFLTFGAKTIALEWLTIALGDPIVEREANSRDPRSRSRRTAETTTSPHVLAVLQANALSFSAVLLLLLLRYWFSQAS
jgi:hypothetical protein